jgi:hypothetical protein
LTPTFSVSRRIAPLAGVVAILMMLPLPARATQVRDLSLAGMAETAGSVFSGRVTAVQPAEVNGLPVTRVTFQVADAVKGVSGATTTLTFLGGQKTAQFARIIPGMPSFSIGEDWVLLTYPPSELGLTAPMGIHQGAFRVHNLAGGPLREGAGFTVTLPNSGKTKKNAMNPANSAGISATGLDEMPPGSSSSYGAFMRRLRDLTGGPAGSRAIQPDATSGEDSGQSAETAAAAAARGTRRQP